MDKLLHIVLGSLVQIQELLNQCFRVLTFEDDAEDELDEDEQFINVLLLYEQFHVNDVMSKRAHTIACIRMRVKPKFHLTKHVLVDLLQCLGVLLLLRLLLVQILVRELLEVLCVNLLHDEVQCARSNEVVYIAGVAWQILERCDPVSD